jgi:hypothetical protein
MGRLFCALRIRKAACVEKAEVTSLLELASFKVGKTIKSAIIS